MFAKSVTQASTGFSDIDLVTCVALYIRSHVLADTGIFRFKMDASTWSIEKCEGAGVEAGVVARSATVLFS